MNEFSCFTKGETMEHLVNDAIKSMSSDGQGQKAENLVSSEESKLNDFKTNAQRDNIVSKSDAPQVAVQEETPLSDTDMIKWFSELNNKDIGSAGGKGASLGEMYNNKFPVPPGFVITAQAFSYFLKPNSLKDRIKNILEVVDVENTAELEKASKEVRSLIESQEMAKDLKEEIIESYKILGSEKIEAHGVSKDALNILKHSQEPIFVSVRSSATTEDLVDASFAGQQESFLNVKGDSEIIEKVKKCFSSLYTPRAIFYRKKKGFEEGQALLAVVIQKMVDSAKSGVAFSRNPINQEDKVVIEAVYGLGEGIVGGKIKPDHYVATRDLKVDSVDVNDKKIAIVRTSSGKNGVAKLNEERSNQQVLSNGQILEVADLVIKLEDHYKKPQDVEFAIEDDKVYIVQSRPITTLEKKEVGEELKGKILLKGLGASPGVGIGKVILVESMEDLNKVQKGDVLVTKMTNPDMVVSMAKSVGIITNEGGMTSHAAIVSREMGIPCIVGTGEATDVLKEGMIVTVDGSHGQVFEGKVGETEMAEVLPALQTNRIKLKVIVDLPGSAERAAKSDVKDIGLMRLEGVIAGSGNHPLFHEKNNTLNEYTNLLRDGIEKIMEHFNSIWIRTSDIRSDEYSTLKGAPEKEINPMLGLHGIRFSLKHPKILEAELEAVKQVALKNPNKKFGLMFPLVISIEEVNQAKEYYNRYKTDNMEFGVMVETPAAVQIIDDICKEVDFISFGTNDLTQFTLGVDRGEDKVQHLYNELHPAVLSEIKRVIGACKRNKVQSSICGQAGSKKEMIEFLFKKGIDSISVNADAALMASKLILEMEKQRDEFHKDKNIEKKSLDNSKSDQQKVAQVNETPQNSNNQKTDTQNIASSQSNSQTIVSSHQPRVQKTTNQQLEMKKSNIENEYKDPRKHNEIHSLIKDKRGSIMPDVPSSGSREQLDISEFKEEERELKEERDSMLRNIPIKAHHNDMENHFESHVEENVGQIKPMDNLDHIEQETNKIKLREREEVLDGLREEHKKSEKQLTSEEIIDDLDREKKEESGRGESVGIFKPKNPYDNKDSPPAEEYRFDDE
jgi:pyruvate, water dikinase